MPENPVKNPAMNHNEIRESTCIHTRIFLNKTPLSPFKMVTFS